MLGTYAWFIPKYGRPALAGVALFFLALIAGVLEDIRDKLDKSAPPPD
jgi:hypothetical protein